MSSTSSPSRVRVLVLGGGYGGSLLSQTLERESHLRVTLVDQKNYFAHNLAPFCVASRTSGSASARTFSPLSTLLRSPNSIFVHGTVLHIDPVLKQVTVQKFHPEQPFSSVTPGSSPVSQAIWPNEYDSTSSSEADAAKAICYDYLVFALGSRYGMPGKLSAAFCGHALDQIGRLAELSRKSANVVVIGGGAVGCELSAHLAIIHPDSTVKITLLHSGSRLIGDVYSEQFSADVLEALCNLNISVRFGVRPLAVFKKNEEKQAVNLWDSGKDQGFLAGDFLIPINDNEILASDLIFWCTGAIPQTQVLRSHSILSSILTSSGRIRVAPTFQVEGFDDIFAIGDCCAMEKMFWHASKHALIAAHNIALLTRAPQSYTPLVHSGSSFPLPPSRPLQLKRYRAGDVPPLGLRLSASGPLVCSHDEGTDDPLAHALR